MTNRCMVVIGHVDHGKTALVRALTGMETDRLEEERARGLSITLGFAHRSYAQGTLDLIDAPGHADFIAAMVSGASGAQGALLVVSAVEGICAQTREHLEIARLLGIDNGVVAVTKSDLLAPAHHAATLQQIGAALADTALAQAPLVLCSALSGAGMADLDEVLHAQLLRPTRQDGPLDSYLPVDRVFSVKGHGTVVTGTLLGSTLAVGTPVIVQPSGRPATIRGLQARGDSLTQVQPGARVAVNLRGVAVEDVARGTVIATDDGRASSCFDVRLDAAGIRHMDQIRVLFGTTSAVATVRLVQGEFAQLRFAAPQAGYAGQRAVLRRLSPVQTLGGALILDPQARAVRKGDVARTDVLAAAAARNCAGIARALCAAQGGCAQITDIARLARLSAPDVIARLGADFLDLGDNALAPAADLAGLKADMMHCLAQYHADHPLHGHAPAAVCLPQRVHPALVAHVVQSLSDAGVIHRPEGGFALAGHDPLTRMTDQQRARMAGIEDSCRAAGLSPAPAAPEGSEDAALTALSVSAGRLLVLRNVGLGQELLLHREAVGQAAHILHTEYGPAPFTTSQARDTLHTSRRVIVPLLEHFDTTGTTVRSGDLRRMASAYPVSTGALPR